MADDLTGTLKELRAAYRAYQNAKRDRKEEIREKYEARIAEETRAAVESEKYAFAKLLADRKEFFNIRVTDIQDHVLRTRNWKVWEDIRDYAEIEPEQVVRDRSRETRTKQKELLKRGFEWNSEYSLLTVYKLPDRELPHPFILSNFGVLGERTDIELPPRIIRGLEEKGVRIPLIRFLTSLVRDAVDSGLVPADRMVSTDETVARTEADNPFYVVEKRTA